MAGLRNRVVLAFAVFGGLRFFLRASFLGFGVLGLRA